MFFTDTDAEVFEVIENIPLEMEHRKYDDDENQHNF